MTMSCENIQKNTFQLQQELPIQTKRTIALLQVLWNFSGLICKFVSMFEDVFMQLQPYHYFIKHIALKYFEFPGKPDW